MTDPSENFGHGVNARVARVSIVTPSSSPPNALIDPVAFQDDAFQADAFQTD